MTPFVREPDWQNEKYGVRLYLGDCLEVMGEMEDGAVDAVVTDPPYPKEFLPTLTACWPMCAKVCTPDAFAFIMSGQLYLDAVMDGCVLAFWNPAIAGQYGNGGHYLGSFFKRAWSPTIDLTSYPDRGYLLNSQVYGDLPIFNWVFLRHYVRYVQDVTCPTGAWSPPATDSYVYYMPLAPRTEGSARRRNAEYLAPESTADEAWVRRHSLRRELPEGTRLFALRGIQLG